MTQYIGNTNNLIDWDNVIAQCQQVEGDKNTVAAIDFRVSSDTEMYDAELLSSYKEVQSLWQSGKYDFNDIVWHDYYPGQHYGIEVQDIMAELTQCKPLRVFISEVAPGRNVPYHWDVEDKEVEWLKKYDLLHRYVCFIDKPQTGHVLILNDECFHNVKRGEIYKWDHYRDYHAGTNCGFTPQYLFHFLGHK